MEHFTVLGASGFIGGHLARHLQARGLDVRTPDRDDPLTGDLGRVIYCIGLTADFRSRPWDTVEAHVSKLVELLRRGNFTSLVYLSSTRVYIHLGADRVGEESAVLPVDVSDPDEIFNLSKLAGEAACLASPNPAVRIARIANTYGDDLTSDNFLTSIIRDALDTGHIHLRTALTSAKDYVSVHDVVRALRVLALGGSYRVYNVASGRNYSHAEIVGWLAECCGCTVSVKPDAPEIRFPRVSVERLRADFAYEPAALDQDIRALVEQYRR